MNCYLCLIETGYNHQPAYVLCQKCMAGICEEHLIEMGTVSLSGYPPRPHFLCQRCYHLLYHSTRLSLVQSNQHRKKGTTFSWRSWWQHLWWYQRHWQTPLPTPEEALETVEDYLRKQRRSS